MLSEGSWRKKTPRQHKMFHFFCYVNTDTFLFILYFNSHSGCFYYWIDLRIFGLLPVPVAGKIWSEVEETCWRQGRPGGVSIPWIHSPSQKRRCLSRGRPNLICSAAGANLIRDARRADRRAPGCESRLVRKWTNTLNETTWAKNKYPNQINWKLGCNDCPLTSDGSFSQMAIVNLLLKLWW